MDVLAKAAGDNALTASQLAKVCTAAQDQAVVRQFVTQQEKEFSKLAGLLQVALNTDGAVKNKTLALVTLANFARYKMARDRLYDVIKHVDASFEKTLKDKEEASEAFGTALGQLHSTMMVFMMRVFSYRVSGEEVLEFSSNKVPFALNLLISIFKVPTYEVELVANCCFALCQMTALKDTQEGSAVAEYQAAIDVLATNVLRQDVIALASTAIKRCLKAPATAIMSNAAHGAVKWLTRAIFNLYTYCPSVMTATCLRQSLLISCDLVTGTLPMYIQLCYEEIHRCVDLPTGKLAHPITPVLPLGITQALKCMSFASFHMGDHNIPLREGNAMTCGLLGLPIKEFVTEQPDLYCQLLHYNINIDSLAGEHSLPDDLVLPDVCKSSVILRVLGQLLSSLPTLTTEMLWKMLASSSKTVPLARDGVSFDLLSHLVDVSIQKQSEKQLDTISALDCNFLDEIAEALDKRMESLEAERPEEIAPMRKELKEDPPQLKHLSDLPCLFSAAPAAENRPPPSVQLTSPVHTAAKPSKPVALPHKAQEVWTASLACPTKVQIPPEFTCAINGHLLKVAARAPSGNVYEKETIETWLRKVGSTDPITGDALTADQLVIDNALMARILDWQIGQTSTANDDDADLYQF